MANNNSSENENVAHDAGRNLKDQLTVIEYDSGKPYEGFAFIRADKWGREGVYQGFFASELKKDGTPSAVHRGAFIGTYHGTGQYDDLNFTIAFPDREAEAAPIRAKIKWLNEQLKKNEKALAKIYFRPEPVDEVEEVAGTVNDKLDALARRFDTGEFTGSQYLAAITSAVS